MRLCIHRGSKQIGGSCVEIESHGQRLLLDFGLPLDAEDNHKQYIPSIAGLDGSDPTLLGVLISHPHIDHFGLLTHISEKIPVGIGPAARRILIAAAPFLHGDWSINPFGWSFESEQSIGIGPFTVTPFLVDHSAYDAYSFMIESEGKKIFYSGDLRSHGRKAERFKRLAEILPEQGINVLILEGSALGRLNEDQRFSTEHEIESQLIQTFAATTGMALVHTSGQNIDRIVSIFKASRKTGRNLIIDLYVAAILEATGNNNIPQSHWSDISLYIPQAQRMQIKENAWFDLLKRNSANRIFIEDLRQIAAKSTLIFRPQHRFDLERAKCLDGASYVYSQWEGYWNQGSYDSVKSWLEKHGITKYSIHTSGHANPAQLKELAIAINPDKVVPIHSFYPERYSMIFPNVAYRNDGEWWEI